MADGTQYEGVILFLAILAIIYAVLMFFMPFFIYRIRNEQILTNQYLDQILLILKSLKSGK